MAVKLFLCAYVFLRNYFRTHTLTQSVTHCLYEYFLVELMSYMNKESTYLLESSYLVALLVARRTNDRKVLGSRPTKVVCITVFVDR